VCQAYGEPGESCEAGALCADQAYCADDLTCTARKPLGAPCSAWDECEQDCDAASGTCVDREAFVPDAEICTTGFAYEDWYQP